MKFFHWDLNELAAHIFAEVPVRKVHIKTFDFDIACLSDHPTGTKRGGVCMYYKEFISLIERKDLFNRKECVTTEIMFNNQKCFFICIWRSPSQNQE